MKTSDRLTMKNIRTITPTLKDDILKYLVDNSHKLTIQIKCQEIASRYYVDDAIVNGIIYQFKKMNLLTIHEIAAGKYWH